MPALFRLFAQPLHLRFEQFPDAMTREIDLHQAHIELFGHLLQRHFPKGGQFKNHQLLPAHFGANTPQSRVHQVFLPLSLPYFIQRVGRGIRRCFDIFAGTVRQRPVRENQVGDFWVPTRHARNALAALRL